MEIKHPTVLTAESKTEKSISINELNLICKHIADGNNIAAAKFITEISNCGILDAIKIIKGSL